MDLNKADYLSTGAANWQQGFAIAYVEGKNVSVVTIPINHDGSFIFEGKVYGKRA